MGERQLGEKGLLLKDTKDGESRGLPIDKILLHELLEHRSRVKNEELVFPSYDRNGNVVPLSGVKGSFGRVMKDAGITNFRFHDLRHTFASHYIDERRAAVRACKHPRAQGSEDDAALREAFSGVYGLAAGSNGHHLDTGANSRFRASEPNTY